MKKVFAIAVAGVFVFGGLQVMASPPVEGPVEGFRITTSTNIECVGSVTESESYSWVYGKVGTPGGPIQDNMVDMNGDPVPNTIGHQYGNNLIGPLPGGTAMVNRAAENRFEQNFRSVNGFTTFIKEFGAQSDSTPNLKTDTLIGYQADPAVPAAQATFNERIGLSVVAAGDQLSSALSGLLSLCPWVTSSSTKYPATNEGIAAGSAFTVTALTNFNTLGAATSTGIPQLDYSVNAASSVPGGWAGQGKIQAGFVVELWEGDKAWASKREPIADAAGTEPQLRYEDCPEGWYYIQAGSYGHGGKEVWPVEDGHYYVNESGYVFIGDVGATTVDGVNPVRNPHWIPTYSPYVAGPVPGLLSRTSYSEQASADGLWNFSKSMSYKSVFPELGPNLFPFDEVLPNVLP